MSKDTIEKAVFIAAFISLITSVINNGGIAAMERLWKNERV